MFILASGVYKSILYDSNDTMAGRSIGPPRAAREPEMITFETTPSASDERDRRRNERFAGPFDGLRIGMLDTPLSIFDLSQGGCFVNSMHEQTPGVRFTMKIQLPHVGVITLKAETLYLRSGFGFAVRFVDVDDETASLLEQALERLQDV